METNTKAKSNKKLIITLFCAFAAILIAELIIIFFNLNQSPQEEIVQEKTPETPTTPQQSRHDKDTCDPEEEKCWICLNGTYAKTPGECDEYNSPAYIKD